MKTESIRSLRRWHYLTGLVFGVNLILLSLTGAVLVFHDELDGLLHPQAAQTASVSPAQHDFAPIFAEILQEHPGMRLDSFRFAHDDQLLHRLRLRPVTEGEGEARLLWLDPATARLVPEDHGFDVMHIIFHLHSDLFLGRLGLLYLGIVSLALLFSTISGIILYAPFMKGLAFGAIRAGRVSFVAADLHKLIGVLSLGFQGLMAVTGACLTLGTFVLQLYVYFELRDIQNETPPALAQTAAPGNVDFDQIVNNAQAYLRTQENKMLTDVLFPGQLQGDQFFLVLAEAESGFKKFVPKALLYDRVSGELSRDLQLPWYIQMIALAAPFHFGNFGGWPVKVLYCLLGLTTGGLAVTGYIMYFMRRRKSTESGERLAVAQPRQAGSNGLYVVFFISLAALGGIVLSVFADGWWDLLGAGLLAPGCVFGIWFIMRRFLKGAARGE